MKKVLIFLSSILLVAGVIAVQAQAMPWYDYDGHEYKFVAVGEGTTWTEAKDAADNLDLGNSYLATITTDAENAFIITQFGSLITNPFYPRYEGGLWIGGSRSSVSDPFNWENGEGAIPEGTTSWLSPEPNGQLYLSILEKIGTSEGTNGNGIGWADITNDGIVGNYAMTGYIAERTATAPVPEPATMLLLGTGLAGLAGSRFRRKKK